MAAPSNPFYARDRLHFPEFSPIFHQHVTPENAQKGFRWSIDHIARLKPADIDTDPHALVKTNGRSPESDEETQKAADKFFSQHTILPSPWPAAQTRRNMRHFPAPPTTAPPPSITPSHVKKVTFSPLPPSMAYIRNESTESEIREDGLVDAGTQTVLTLPLSCKLDMLLGPAYTYTGEEASNATRDLANSSLRRKLFGQPERQANRGEGGGDGEREGEREVCMDESQDNGADMCDAPSKHLTDDRHLSSTPLKPHSSHTSHSHHHPSLSPNSPAILLATGAKQTCPNSDTNPTASSFQFSPGGNLPEFSPIGKDKGAPGLVPSGTGRGKENSEACKRLFSATPKKETPHNIQSTPSPLPTCLPFSPILSHPSETSGSGGKGTLPRPPAATPAAMRERANSASKATSTPYTRGARRHLAVSHGSSPVVATPSPQVVVKGPDTAHARQREEEEERDEGMEEEEGREEEGATTRDMSEEIPQPLSLADLQTETYDLTSITAATTCTSYFTQLVTEDGDSNVLHERHPLHSTVANPNSLWNPSTVLDPHKGPQFAEATAGLHMLPSIREISRINAPSMNATDSGVATSGTSLSRLTGNDGMGTNVTRQPNMEEERQVKEEEEGKVSSEGSGGLQRRRLESHSLASCSRLPSIAEGECKMEEEGGRRQGGRSGVDSGLVFSPEQDLGQGSLRRQEVVSKLPLTKPPTPVGPPRSCSPYTHTKTPSRCCLMQPCRGRMGGPLTINSKSGFTSRAILHTNVLPSQVRLPSTSPLSLPCSLGLSVRGKSSASNTPNRYTGSSNWFGGYVTCQSGLTSMPEEVLRKKEMLKAKLHLCSPVRSRSPCSPNSSPRIPLTDTLNLPSSTAPFSSLPPHPTTPLSSHPLSPLSSHPFSPLPSRGSSPYSFLPTSPSAWTISPYSRKGRPRTPWQHTTH